ncbi:ATP-grasp domain-containing protein [Eubacteriaceae bacterium ES2]|nr:ATP-grasp domain-containing protein [Eubacteriaceae bacterium ES2]
MKTYNILILCAGRRVELVQAFRRASSDLGIESQIIGADSVELAPALYYCDQHVILPRIEEPDYLPEIIQVCQKYNIALLVPTIDTDLLLLSENRQIIESRTGAKVLVSEFETIKICRDKIKTQLFLEANGFKMPKRYNNVELDHEELVYPLFAKPKSGSSSINTMKIENVEELKAYRTLVKDAIIQDFADGNEYTIDAFMDFDGQIITIVPRHRIAVRTGEISKGQVVKDREIINSVRKLMAVLPCIGHITIQLKKSECGLQYIEINPRFGGGAPMSIRAGADSCKNLYRLLMGECLSYNEDYRDKTYFLRFDDNIALSEDLEVIQW